MLLDDVLSEMDENRRRRVLEKVAGYGQSLITTTDPEVVRHIIGENATYFRVESSQAGPVVARE